MIADIGVLRDELRPGRQGATRRGLAVLRGRPVCYISADGARNWGHRMKTVRRGRAICGTVAG